MAAKPRGSMPVALWEGGVGMAPRENELKIFYGKDAFMVFNHSIAFEHELNQLCERYGLYRWASGQDMTTGIRDMAFDRTPRE